MRCFMGLPLSVPRALHALSGTAPENLTPTPCALGHTARLAGSDQRADESGPTAQRQARRTSVIRPVTAQRDGRRSRSAGGEGGLDGSAQGCAGEQKDGAVRVLELIPSSSVLVMEGEDGLQDGG